MAGRIGYDGRVKGRDRATGKVFGVFAGLVLFATLAAAQINAAPPSVTSLGFGGRAINGAPPSVTSLGPRGYTPGFNPAFPNSRPLFGYSYHHHHPHNSYAPLGAAVYAVPIYGYAYADSEDEADHAAPEDQYNGGPTIFDRRGPGTAAYRPPTESFDQGDEPVAASGQSIAADLPPTEQPKTMLVFKDGHHQEVENYAIVGDTLWDLTGDRRHKIALSDLDLDATVKANDDRGIDFAVPPGS